MTRPTIARIVLCVGLTLCFQITGLMTQPWSELPHPWGLARLVDLSFLLQPAAWSGLGVLYFAALAAFLLRIREDLAGWAVFAVLAVLVTLEMSTRDIFMPNLESMLGGDMLLAWLVGRAVAERRGLTGAEQDAYAHEVVAGVFGALLTIAAGSKLAAAGLDWVAGTRHCSVMYEHGMLRGGALGAARLAIAEQYWLCSIGAVYVLVVEGVGFAMIWPALRRTYATLLAFVFLFLAAFLAIFEVSWPMMGFALAWSSFGGHTLADPAGSGDRR